MVFIILLYKERDLGVLLYSLTQVDNIDKRAEYLSMSVINPDSLNQYKSLIPVYIYIYELVVLLYLYIYLYLAEFSEF